MKNHKDTLQSGTVEITISPSGSLYLRENQENPENILEDIIHRIKDLLDTEVGTQISSVCLLRLGMTPFSSTLPSSLSFWHHFVQIFIHQAQEVVGLESESVASDIRLEPSLSDLQSLMDKAPFMQGSEYLSLDILWQIWKELIHALRSELAGEDAILQNYLARYNPSWNNVGRVCFHLAENKSNSKKPFAFMGTYTKQVATNSNLQHLPLGQALKEYSGENKKPQLLSLLVPVKKASEQSMLIKELVDSGDIFKPLAWTPQEAHTFLKSIPLIEEAGVVVRVPNWWKPQHPPRPQINIEIGNAETKAVGMEALLDFNMSYSLPDGTVLNPEEMKEILEAQGGMMQIKGQWVEIDKDKISKLISHWQKVEDQVREEGLTFAQGIRLLASTPDQEGAEVSQEDISDWSQMIEGDWIKDVLSNLRDPSHAENKEIETILTKGLKGTLRPYQSVGVKWLWLLYNLRLGGCLADDMGLGKTIQVLSLFLLSKKDKTQNKTPHLLILPASLLGNWKEEFKRFSPSLKIFLCHGSVTNRKILKNKDTPDLSDIDVVITTYSNVYRVPWMSQVPWNILILDEAQNIKNPSSKQTISIKKLKSQVRFILTGTPIENRLLDLWSLFDFIAPGLLGSSKVFTHYGVKAIKENVDDAGKEQFYGAIRHLVSPYILRRLKNDKSIISDLPDKTEIDTHCFLTKQQAALYKKSVEELQKFLKLSENNDAMKRRGLVLSYLTRFKQICNHPTQWLGHGEYTEEESGKFIRLKELAKIIEAKQEKVLVFTQYKEIIPALHDTLEEVFGRAGLILHGQTSIKNRPKLVELFQEEQGPPFFILSIKAGGTGLNLTRASHVIHFDRWWNPAVEAQATDRAYRIGQKKNVLVHKFICQGTIEEKIDTLINSKKELSSDILSKNTKPTITEMSNEDLLNVVSLDIHRALGDNAQG
ncbi:MAG: DEAD/DEAH box helicase [bacterium]|nr:DEAD/DEAH box helicase [bacterium]